jgi:hypothetical protein
MVRTVGSRLVADRIPADDTDRARRFWSKFLGTTPAKPDQSASEASTPGREWV